MAKIDRRESAGRKHTRTASIGSLENALASFTSAEARIVQEKRFKGLRDLSELELMEAATELTLRK